MAIPFNKSLRKLQRWEYQYIKDNASILTITEFEKALSRSYEAIKTACKLLRVQPRKRQLYRNVPAEIPDVEEYKSLYK